MWKCWMVIHLKLYIELSCWTTHGEDYINFTSIFTFISFFQYYFLMYLDFYVCNLVVIYWLYGSINRKLAIVIFLSLQIIEVGHSFFYINLVQSISNCPFSQITRNKLSFTLMYNYLAKSHHRYLDLIHVLLKITNWDNLLCHRDPHIYYCLTQHSCKAEITQQEK